MTTPTRGVARKGPKYETEDSESHDFTPSSAGGQRLPGRIDGGASECALGLSELLSLVSTDNQLGIQQLRHTYAHLARRFVEPVHVVSFLPMDEYAEERMVDCWCNRDSQWLGNVHLKITTD